MSIVIKPFQMATVRAVLHGLDQPWMSEGRFLVADEVGLGKTVVARGVIGEMLAAQRKMTVFYIANGRRVASQNAERLIPDGQAQPMTADRLGLLHQQRTRENHPRGKLSLYTFTPETSFKIRGTGEKLGGTCIPAPALENGLRSKGRRNSDGAKTQDPAGKQQATQYIRRHKPSQ